MGRAEQDSLERLRAAVGPWERGGYDQNPRRAGVEGLGEPAARETEA